MAASSFYVRIQRLLGVLIALCALACAGVESRFAASPVDAQGRLTGSRTTPSGLAISSEELRSYGSEFFGLIEVTFENRTPEWIHISRLSLDFGEPAKNAAVRVPSGFDLDAWHQATLQRNDIRDTNHATLLTALFAVGETVAVAGALSGSREAAAAGSALALGTATAAAVQGQDRRVQAAEAVRVAPQSHLLRLPFAVPPGMFAKKWVLLQTTRRSAPCISWLLIDYDVEERGRERALLRFRGEYDRSEWQRHACRPPY